MRVFALDSSRLFGEKVAALLDRSLDPLEERNFDDGEHKIRPLVSVRDEDIYVIHSLYSDDLESVNDKLCKLLFLIATLRDHGAGRITAVIPYLCYARKDRRTKARDPVTMRYVASLFEAVRVDRILTVDVHNLQAFQNAFRCNTEHLEAQKYFLSYFQSRLGFDGQVVVMSPDIGGVKRAEQFRDSLAKALGKEVGFAFMEKMRSEGVLSGEMVIGDIEGKEVIILDDLINTGSTMARAAAACKARGAARVYGVATHGAFVDGTQRVFEGKAFDQVVVTNTIVSRQLKALEHIVAVVDLAPLFSETIRRLNAASSLMSIREIE